jgi:hypothetical protein
MTLDLDELIAGWECPPGELRARTVNGRDGRELIQLRIDLGVMQMFTDGRPDGERYHGLASARTYAEHELRVGGEQLTAADWQEIERELLQTNYRRMAFASAAEDALQDGRPDDARRFFAHALADVEECLVDLRLLKEHEPNREDGASLEATLVFDQARLGTQLQVIEGRFEDAIEKAETGAEALDTLLSELGYDDEQRDVDPGLRYLWRLGNQLRQEYGISRTLHEQLAEAIENEDFETAAQIRDELARRDEPPSPA